MADEAGKTLASVLRDNKIFLHLDESDFSRFNLLIAHVMYYRQCQREFLFSNYLTGDA